MKDIDEPLGQFDFVKNARKVFSFFPEMMHRANDPQSDSWKCSSDARASLADSFQGLIAHRKKIKSIKNCRTSCTYAFFHLNPVYIHDIARCGSSPIRIPEMPSFKFNCKGCGLTGPSVWQATHRRLPRSHTLPSPRLPGRIWYC